MWTCDFSHDYVTINADYRCAESPVRHQASRPRAAARSSAAARTEACSRASRRCCRRRPADPDWTQRHRVPLAQARRPRLPAGGRASARDRARRPGRDRRRRSTRSTATRGSSSPGCPANNVLLTGSRGTGKSSLVKAMLAKYAAQGPAADRGRQGRSRRPARHRRARRGPPRALHRVLRRPDVRRRRARLQGAQGDARRLDRRRRRQRAHLRDVEPPPPAARVLQREPRDEARRRRGASRASRSRRRSRCRSASACGSRSIRSRRTTTSPPSRGWLAHFGVSRPRARARPRRARARRCSGRCSAARAAAASPGSSRRGYAGAAGAASRGARRSRGAARSRRWQRRPRRRGGDPAARRPGAARAAPARARPTPATGSFPAASSSPARRRAHALDARAARGARHRRAPRRRRGSCRSSSIRTRTSSSTSSACSRGTASCTATTGRRSRGRRRAASTVAPLLPANTRILARARAAGGLRHHLRGRHRRGRVPRARASARSTHGLRLVQLRDKEWPRARRRAFAQRSCRSRIGTARTVLLNGTADEARACGLRRRALDGARRSRGDARGPTACSSRASCHDARRSSRTPGALGLDFAVLGPVRRDADASGRDAARLGRLRRARSPATRLPVYALGGLAAADLDRAIAHGAHGVALRRGAWQAALSASVVARRRGGGSSASDPRRAARPARGRSRSPTRRGR